MTFMKAFYAAAKPLGVEVGSVYPVSGSCERHGAYAYDSVVPPREGVTMCPCCQDEKCHAADIEAQRRVRDSRQDMTLMSRRAGTPGRFRNASLANYRVEHEWQRVAHEEVAGFASRLLEFRQSGAALLLHGPIGTGKTHLVCGLAHEIIRQGYPCRYATHQDLFSEYVALDYESKKTLLKVDFLILDEALRLTNDHMIQFLQEVVEARYSNELPLVLAGDFSIESLDRHLGARAADRLRQLQLVLVDLSNGHSMRNDV